MLTHNKKRGVKPGSETLITSYDVPSKNIVTLRGFVAFGTCPAIYRLYVGTKVTGFCMTSEADREAVVKIEENVVGPATIALKVIHYVPAARVDDYHDFEGSILGEGC